VTLDEHSVLGYLADRGVLDHGPASAKALTGGVSNVVLLVETPERRVVLKQALPRLRVADEWYADPARIEAEAAARAGSAAGQPRIDRLLGFRRYVPSARARRFGRGETVTAYADTAAWLRVER
jgi:hypothetical protein